MIEDTVIVRAASGQPLRRVVIESRNGLVYVANPALLDRVKNGASHPVGFPVMDVFAFDEDVYASLEAVWQTNGATVIDDWRNASRPETLNNRF